MFRFLCLVLLLPLLASCAARGSLFTGFQPVPEGQAQIVVYRPDLFRAGGQSMDVVFDRKAIGALKNAGWLLIPTVPGEHALELDEGGLSFSKPLRVQVPLDSRQRKIFRVLPGGVTGGIFLSSGPVLAVGPWTVHQVNEQEAAAEIAGLRQSD